MVEQLTAMLCLVLLLLLLLQRVVGRQAQDPFSCLQSAPLSTRLLSHFTTFLNWWVERVPLQKSFNRLDQGGLVREELVSCLRALVTSGKANKGRARPPPASERVGSHQVLALSPPAWWPSWGPRLSLFQNWRVCVR